MPQGALERKVFCGWPEPASQLPCREGGERACSPESMHSMPACPSPPSQAGLSRVGTARPHARSPRLTATLTLARAPRGAGLDALRQLLPCQVPTCPQPTASSPCCHCCATGPSWSLDHWSLNEQLNLRAATEPHARPRATDRLLSGGYTRKERGVHLGGTQVQDRPLPDPPSPARAPQASMASSCHHPGLHRSPPLFLEGGVLQGLVGADSLIGIIGHHCVQEGEALRGQTGRQ